MGVPADGPWRALAAIVIGIGASLVFDEFALLLNLKDDYWQAQGRESLQAVGLVAACLAFWAIGFAPLGVNDVGTPELGVRYGVLIVVAITAAAVVVCALKGKYRLALVALFLWPVAMAGAIRLARPGSWWEHEPTRPRRRRARRLGRRRSTRGGTRCGAASATSSPGLPTPRAPVTPARFHPRGAGYPNREPVRKVSPCSRSRTTPRPRSRT